MNFKRLTLLLLSLLLSACGTPAPVGPSNPNPDLETLERGSYYAQTVGTCQVTGEAVPVTVRIQSLEQGSSGNYTFKLLLDFGIKTDFNRGDYQDVTLRANAEAYTGDIIFTQFDKQLDKGDFVVTPGAKDGEGYPTLEVTFDAGFTGECYDPSAPSLEAYKPLNVKATFHKLRRAEPYPNQTPR